MYRMKEKGSKDFIYSTQVAHFYLAVSESMSIETPHQYSHTYIWQMHRNRNREIKAKRKVETIIKGKEILDFVCIFRRDLRSSGTTAGNLKTKQIKGESKRIFLPHSCSREASGTLGGGGAMVHDDEEDRGSWRSAERAHLCRDA